MTTSATLLVTLDDSANAVAALSVARSLAHLNGSTVVLVHVSRELLAPDALIARLNLSADDARGLVIDQCTGSPSDAILREAAARHAVTIVMCSPPEPGGPLQVVGSVLGDVLLAAPCPVVLVPSMLSRYPWVLRQLVLPHDGTPTSGAAIAPAADLASRAGADLVVLHVATPSDERPAETGTYGVPRYLDQQQHEWSAWSREFLERVRGFGYPANIKKMRLVLAHGEVGAAILTFARSNASDLIALAWRGRLEPERAHTIRRVIRYASCPVIVFRVQES